MVAHSSTETEYLALASVATEVVWLQSLFTELGITIEHSPILWCDNVSANSLASNPVFHARTKHIEIDAHFVCDKVLAKELDVHYVSIELQLADLLTKPLPMTRFYFLRG